MDNLPALLRAHGIQARKDLGQHWLIDPAAVEAIVEAADIQPKAHIIEVGPGPGVLTPLLCARAKYVTAVELDEQMIEVLKPNTATLPNLTIQQGDILAIDPAALPQPYQLVGNVPYYITSAILKHFLNTDHQPERITVTIQKEVAERIVATPPRMSLLALSIQLYGTSELVRLIPKESFYPQPKVDSAVLVIRDIGVQTAALLAGAEEATFWKVARAGFAEKRKQLHNALTRHLHLPADAIQLMLAEAGINPLRRAETLTIHEWVQLTHAFQKR